MKDAFNLERFVQAQDLVYLNVLAELRRGRKERHWIWFIFPQIEGLGHSDIAERFGISSLAEAKAYLQHPTLGPRLIQCTDIVNAWERRSAYEIFGEIDSLKFRSSMTLFSQVEPKNAAFSEALHKFFGGDVDPLTTDLL